MAPSLAGHDERGSSRVQAALVGGAKLVPAQPLDGLARAARTVGDTASSVRRSSR